jgi:hypothetical protein
VEPDGVDDEDPVVEDVAKAGEHNQPFPKHPFALLLSNIFTIIFT